MIWLLGCQGGETDPDRPDRYDPIDAYEQVSCDVTGEEGLAIHIQAGPLARHGEAFPVLVRVWPPHRSGFDDVLPVGPATDGGAALVRLLGPGEGADGHASGGPTVESGLARVEAVRCALDWVRTSFPRPVSAVVLTGQSLGGNTALHAFDDADGVVLFEPPLVDQLVMDEPAPGDVADPTFVPGTCTLAGCPFPGRAERLRYRDGVLFHDLNGNDLVDGGEPVERWLPGEDGAPGYISLDLDAEVQANRATVFEDGRLPANWPADGPAFWAYRDATPALVRARDTHTGRFLLVATERDHVQPWHDHVRLAQDALSQAAWFRVNPDAAYIASVGAPDVGELDAFEVVADPDAPGALPEGLDDPIVLAAELELSDRVWASVWEADLDAVIAP